MITVECAARRHREVATRVEFVAEDLGRVAARKLGCPIPKARIVVTDGASMIRAFERAENQLAGAGATWRKAKEAAWDWCHHRRDCGATVYDRDGILVIINAPVHRRHMGQVDKTVIHELTHAIQLTAPGVRDQHRLYQRMRLGAEPRDAEFLTRYVQAMATAHDGAEGAAGDAEAPREARPGRLGSRTRRMAG